jgi:hypothetical protein
MAILNYTTSIDSEKSISEIGKCLVRHGANKIVTDYIDGLPSAVMFSLKLNGAIVSFSLPANYAGVLNAMKNDKKVPRSKCTNEQALKVAWRIVKDWVEAQCAIIEAGLAKTEEVFLPYLITKSGDTLFKHISNNQHLFLTDGN